VRLRRRRVDVHHEDVLRHRETRGGGDARMRRRRLEDGGLQLVRVHGRSVGLHLHDVPPSSSSRAGINGGREERERMPRRTNEIGRVQPVHLSRRSVGLHLENLRLIFRNFLRVDSIVYGGVLLLADSVGIYI